jgi:hypothetical protein
MARSAVPGVAAKDGSGAGLLCLYLFAAMADLSLSHWTFFDLPQNQLETDFAQRLS